jgi:hypothetical protein
MNKGITIVTLTLLILILVIFVYLLGGPILGITQGSASQRLSMAANEISGVINLIQASPEGTFHVVSLEKSCTVEITPESTIVSVQIDEKKVLSSKSGIIKSSVAVEPATLDCKIGAAYVMRCGSTIRISQKTKPCEY